MIRKLFHFLFGHLWSPWKSKVYDEGYYDEERWQERDCSCGAKQTRED